MSVGKNYVFLLIVSLGLLLHTYGQANAGDERGNGGDVVVCRDASGDLKSIQLLDFYEAETLRGIKRDMGPAESFLGKVKYVLDKRAQTAPFRAKLWWEQASTFESDAKFLSGVTLEDIPDSEHLVFPAGCTVEQIVIQKEPNFPEDKRYTVNKDLWDLLDNDNRAGLILHEVIYREAQFYDQKNSTNSRYLNSIWTGSNTDAYFKSLEKLNGLFKVVRFGAGEGWGCNPMLFHLKSGGTKFDFSHPYYLSYSASGQMTEVSPSYFPATIPITTTYGSLKADCHRRIGEEYSLQFNEAGSAVYAASAHGQLANNKFSLVMKGDALILRKNKSYLGGKGWVKVQSQQLNFDKAFTLGDHNNVLMVYHVTSDYLLKDAQGKKYRKSGDSSVWISFDNTELLDDCRDCELVP